MHQQEKQPANHTRDSSGAQAGPQQGCSQCLSLGQGCLQRSPCCRKVSHAGRRQAVAAPRLNLLGSMGQRRVIKLMGVCVWPLMSTTNHNQQLMCSSTALSPAA